ncbi:MAG: aspartate carbamoyltransferase regulatory subunit [Clostridia bacterium]|nr:aspartate carbamoyltransferase regulatory subunit [Clostridia bacterium]
MRVDAIINGLVIDHITAGKAMEIVGLLKLDELNLPIAIIKNAPSNRLGKKDIIKIDGDIELNFEILGYIDPDVTINIIKNGEITEKKHVELPETLNNVISCKNPRCISSCEQELPQIFKLTDRENRVYRCLYCETKAK